MESVVAVDGEAQIIDVARPDVFLFVDDVNVVFFQDFPRSHAGIVAGNKKVSDCLTPFLLRPGLRPLDLAV